DSGKDKLPTEQQSLDTLLDDGNLRAGVAKLFPNGNFNPIALADRKDEKTLWYNFNDNEITIDSRLQKQRDLIVAAIEVYNAAQNEKLNDNDKWIRFTKDLSFMKDGKDVVTAWQEAMKSEPKFVTQYDIDISHKIHEWLIGDDAKGVLQGEPPNNFIEALQRVGDEKNEMKFYRFIEELGEKKQEKIADNDLKPEYKKLKDAWKQFQKQCPKAFEL
ncbi:MAG: hypothetical protein LBQ50_04545, partial [Planctomycetaceae bacterium]|nr:hypothetical protein [Planctomycetaceae bacterium]